jgi:pilus assembly protein CpaC
MQPTYLPTRISRAALRGLAAAMLAMVGLAPVAALAASNGQSGPVYLHVSAQAMGSRQQVALDVNKSMILDLPTEVGEVIASQPTVATVVMRTKTRAIVQGVAGGDTNIFFLDPAGNNITVLDIRVVQPRSDVGNALEAAIARNIPGSRIRVESVSLGDANRVVLSGTALSQDDVDKAKLIAVQFAGGIDNVASIISVAGNQQVMLKVTVAEVNRTAVKELGLNLSIAGGSLITGMLNRPNDALGLTSGITSNVGGGQVTASANLGGLQVTAALQALARRNALRTLAEPVLTAMSGQPAEFLVGGEIPFETLDPKSNVITVTYKQYGVKLNFTPTVKSNGTVNLVVDTSVSEPAGGGAITERAAKTTVEVPEGCTLAIGGLIQDTEKHQLAQFPGLGDIPILGALFRSRDYLHDQTELVIMVTPVLADYGRPDLPTDNYAIAGDAEAIFLGHLEKQYGVGNEGMRGGYKGSVGFVLD